MDVRLLCNLDDFFDARRPRVVAVGNVLADRTVEQCWFLLNEPDSLAGVHHTEVRQRDTILSL